jgi:hypothetical protein
MSIIDGLVAGLIAGIIMIVVSEIGYHLNLIKGNLVIIDGSFAWRMIVRNNNTVGIYILGILIHLVTSLVFGLVYALLTRIVEFDSRSVMPIAIYIFLLWLTMLFVALPIAGQGLFGKKVGNSIWLEQLFLHAVFGVAFWWVLGF